MTWVYTSIAISDAPIKAKLRSNIDAEPVDTGRAVLDEVAAELPLAEV